MSCFSKLRYPETKQYITKLQDAILFTVNNNDNTSEIEYLEELDEEMPNKQGDSLTYKDKSPFGKHFQNIYNKCSNFIPKFKHKIYASFFRGKHDELYLGPFKRYVTLRGEVGISKNVTERDRGGRGFALALRNAGMSA